MNNLAHMLLQECLQKDGAYVDFPFGEAVLCVKVRGKVMAQFFMLGGRPKLTLKCTPDYGDFMKQQYPGKIVRGYHCPPVMQPHFVTIALDEELPRQEHSALLAHAYQTVVAKLPKKLRPQTAV